MHLYLPHSRLARPNDGLGAVGDLQLAENIRNVVAHRFWGEYQPPGDGRVGKPLGGRPQHLFSYRHIKGSLFFGIEYRLLVDDAYAYVATPEKALLDLIYFRPQGDSTAYLESLRLQNLDTLDLERLHQFAERAVKPKLKRAADRIAAIAGREAEEYEPL